MHEPSLTVPATTVPPSGPISYARTARVLCAAASVLSREPAVPVASAKARNSGERIMARSLVMRVPRLPQFAAVGTADHANRCAAE